MSLRPAAEVAREWLGAQFRSMPSVLRDEDHASLTTLIVRVRAEALREAAEVCEGHARSFDMLKPKGRKTIAEAHAMAGQQSRACGHYILALLPARLDPDGTAKGKTILTAHVSEGGCREGTMSVGPVGYHVDTETGKRTPLGPVKP